MTPGMKLSSRRSRRWLALCAAALAMLAPAAFAIARAGGGQGFSGGGGHGGGGGGGGGGGDLIDLIEFIFWVIYFCCVHPFIGIPSVIGVFVLLYYLGRTGNDAYNSNVIKRGSDVIDNKARDAMVDSLKQS